MEIHKKIHVIMSELGFVKKDKVNAHFGYSYASEQAIKESIQPLLVKHGVVFQLDCIQQEREGDITNASFGYKFTDTETGTSIFGSFQGSGQDKGDKGLYKAITGAIKYIMTSTFLIPTGDDPEDTKGQRKEVKGKKLVSNPIDNDEVPF